MKHTILPLLAVSSSFTLAGLAEAAPPAQDGQGYVAPSTPTFEDVDPDTADGFPVAGSTFTSFEEPRTKSFICPNSPDNICLIDALTASAARDLDANEFVDTWCDEDDLGTGRCEYKRGTMLPRLTGAQDEDSDRYFKPLLTLSTYYSEVRRANGVLTEQLKVETRRSETFSHWLSGLGFAFVMSWIFFGYYTWKVRREAGATLPVEHRSIFCEHDKTQQS